MAGQILIVDDDQVQSKVTSALLQEAGWDIRVVGSDEQAREVLKSFHPQLILVDLQVPGLDVPQFARLLKLDPEQDGAKILALTASTRPADPEQARLTGCDGYISKPIDARNFVELVRHFSTHPSGDSDCRDLPAEVRNGFFAEGMDRCATILTELRSGGAVAPELVRRIIRRWRTWAGCWACQALPTVHSESKGFWVGLKISTVPWIGPSKSPIGALGQPHPPRPDFRGRWPPA